MPSLFKSGVQSQKPSTKRGFTLIELLVVITIIGILATLIVASFTSAQRKSRDTRRKSDLDAVKKALELAKGDCSGQKYPAPVGYAALMPPLEFNGYIKDAPNDPSGGAATYSFTTSGTSVASACLGGTGARDLAGNDAFVLSAVLENANDPSGDGTAVGTSGIACGVTTPVARTYYVCSN